MMISDALKPVSNVVGGFDILQASTMLRAGSKRHTGMGVT
jgi:hypothetical protein